MRIELVTEPGSIEDWDCRLLKSEDKKKKVYGGLADVCLFVSLGGWSCCGGACGGVTYGFVSGALTN